jgi:hypothetical protein
MIWNINDSERVFFEVSYPGCSFGVKSLLYYVSNNGDEADNSYAAHD